MGISARVRKLLERKKLPSWVTLNEQDENNYIVDVNKAYPFWQRELKGNKDKYWAEVYRRCTTTFLHEFHEAPLRVTLTDPSKTGTWKLSNLEGTEEDEAKGAGNFMSYYNLFKNKKS